jgi:hypothetical protein
MKPSLFTALLLFATCAPAQDVEPTLARAIRSLVSELVSELPYRARNGEALAIDAAPSSDRKVIEAFTAQLLRSGFRVQAGGGAADDAVPVRVSTGRKGELGAIKVEAGDWSAERLFGRADWIDAPRDDSTIVVAGAPKSTIEEAVRSASDRVDAELRARFPGLAGNAAFERYASRKPATSFVSRRTIDGRQVFEAWVLAEPELDNLARAERAALRSARRTPWVRSAVLAGAAVVLYGLYVRADFRTRGWRTRRLRFFFGTLFVALSAGLWSLPL